MRCLCGELWLSLVCALPGRCELEGAELDLVKPGGIRLS